MAKGQLRGNRETKKPKQKKTEAVVAPTTFKGTLVPVIVPKKKA